MREIDCFSFFLVSIGFGAEFLIEKVQVRIILAAKVNVKESRRKKP